MLPAIALMVTFCEGASGGTGTKGDKRQGQSKGSKDGGLKFLDDCDGSCF